MHSRGRLVALIAASVLGAAGCGGDDEVATPAPPELTVPEDKNGPELGDTTTEESTTGETTTDGSTDDPTDALPAPATQDDPTSSGDPAASPSSGASGGSDGSGRTADPARPDTPENDTPPPPNSPEADFEQFCDENPGACG